MRVLELFGGYGSQALSLENLCIDFKSDLCEIDKYAIKAYNQLHGETFNYGDICSIDETKLPYYDLITYSSPCQDFSVAGKQAGGDKGSGTRSSLLWECERIIRAVKPKYLLMENVKNLVGKKHISNFIKWLKVLTDIGYKNYWKVLNAKDYGVPQNRERVFVVSILGDGQFQFPEPIPLTKRLKDILEPVVDEKYYISKQFEQYIENKKKKDYDFRVETSNPDGIRKTPLRANGDKACVVEPINTEYDGTRRTIKAQYYKNARANFERKDSFGATGVRIIQEPMNLYPTSGNPQAGRVYNADGISPAMDTCSGGNRMPKIIDDTYANRPAREYDDSCPAIRSQRSGLKVKDYRIRKLTPRECWRLMGVRDEQFDKLHDISNSQLYKLAGNSIVVDVLMAIFRNLFIDKEQKGQLQLL